MKIILKHTLKNMISKPLRTFVLIFCITVTTVAAFLMLDMSNSISGILQNYFADMVGKTDIMIQSSQKIKDEALEGTPDCEKVSVTIGQETLMKKNPDYYSYVFEDKAIVYSMDFGAAYRMEVFKEEFSLADDEVAINKHYAENFDYEIGDELILHDKYKQPVSFRVVKVLDEENAFIRKEQNVAVVAQSAMKQLLDTEELEANIVCIDVKDDEKIDEFVDVVKENAPDYEVQNLVGDEGLQEAIGQITSLFALLFVVSFLLVIFITISLSNRIICERMSVIGTFRSLGISSRITTMILLLENALYGLVGAGIGSAIYGVLRNPMMNGIVHLADGSQVKLVPIPVATYLIIFFGAVLVECVSPVYALAKAVKTSIRDIIFANKDTEYLLSKRQTGLGICLLSAGLCCGVLGKENMLIMVFGLIMLVIALALLMPLILSFLSRILTPFFAKLKMPVASFASAEICSKKSTVSSAILSATAISLATVILMLTSSMTSYFKKVPYEADVLVFACTEEIATYSFVEDIEGVHDVTYIYDVSDSLVLDGKKYTDTFYVLGLPDGERYKVIPDLPESLGENEFMTNKKAAKKFGWEVGDTIDTSLNNFGVFPIPQKLTLVGYVDTTEYMTSGVLFVVNKETFLKCYHNYPTTLLISCENPDEVKKIVEEHIMDKEAATYTYEEYQEVQVQSGSSLTLMLYFLLVTGIALTIIGTSGNQIIGFEGRKREYAVMYSTAMTRKKIKRLIFLENFISTGAAVLVAILSSGVLMKILVKILDSLGMGFGMTVRVSDYVIAGIAFWFILMFTCLSPMRALGKMNIAAELKYE